MKIFFFGKILIFFLLDFFSLLHQYVKKYNIYSLDQWSNWGTFLRDNLAFFLYYSKLKILIVLKLLVQS